MASIQLLEEAALESGFVRTTCVHEDNDTHIVYDYPDQLKNTTTAPHWRVHTDMDYKQRRTYIVGHDTDQQQVSLRVAIDFMHRVARQYPKAAS